MLYSFLKRITGPDNRCRWVGYTLSQPAQTGKQLSFWIALLSWPGLQLSASGQCFQAAQTFSAGTQSQFVTVIDLNKDSKLDLIVANFGSDNVSVMLGQGDGTFSGATNFSTGDGPSSLDVADFNGDNKLDLVVANGNASTVSVLLGYGDGTFATKTNYITGVQCLSVKVKDLNGDGKLDIVSANASAETVSVLLGNGNGTFAQKKDYSAGTFPNFVAIEDLDRDGKPDLIISNGNGANVSILSGHGDGTFADAVNYPVNAAPQALVVKDINGDGKFDLIASSSSTNNTALLLGQGDGTFAAKTNIPTGASARFVAMGDINGDGKLDIATVNGGANTASVLLGNGDGTFAARVNFSPGTTPTTVVIADVNGDNMPDLITSVKGNNAVSIMYQLNVPGILKEPVSGSVVCTGASVAVPVEATGSSITYSWYKDGAVLSPAQSTSVLSLSNTQTSNTGNYSVVVTGSGTGVCSLTSAVFSLTVNDTQSVSVTPSSQTIASGRSLTLTASGAESYIWSNGMSGPVITVSGVTSTTTFSVTGTPGGCSGTATVIVSTPITQVPVSLGSFGTIVIAPGLCPGKIPFLGSGLRFQITGPGNYEFNQPFRTPVENRSITATGIKVTGQYKACAFGNPGQTPVCTTFDVIGQNCP